MKRPAWPGELWRQLWLRLADTGLLGYRHALEPLGFAEQPGAVLQPLLDLDRLVLPSRACVRWVSHPYRQSDLPDYPCIESWALRGGRSVSQAAPYRCIQFHTIRRALRKPVQTLDEPLALFPQLTSHFGHWLSQGLHRLTEGPSDGLELNAAVGSRLADAAAAAQRPALNAGVIGEIGMAVGVTHPLHTARLRQHQAIEIEQRLQHHSRLIGKPQGRQGMAVAKQPRISDSQPQLAPQLSRPGRALHQ